MQTFKKSLAILVLSAGLLSAASTRGAFVITGFDARSAALGGAFVSLAQGPQSAYWNPAGLGLFKGRALTGTYGRMGDFPVFYGYLSLIQGNEGLGGGALTWEYLGAKINGDTPWNEHTLAYAWGYPVNGWLNLGLRVKGLFVDNDLETRSGAKGWGVDASVLLTPVSFLRIGITGWDLASHLSWDTGEKESLTPTYQGGASLLLLKGAYVLVAEVKGEQGDALTDLKVGNEVWLFRTLALRVGLQRKMGEEDTRNIFTAGAGFRVERDGVAYLLNYAFSNDNEVLGPIHRVSMNLEWR